MKSSITLSNIQTTYCGEGEGCCSTEETIESKTVSITDEQFKTLDALSSDAQEDYLKMIGVILGGENWDKVYYELNNGRRIDWDVTYFN